MAATGDSSTCSACGWSCQKQHRCGYVSSVKLFYGAGPRGAWSIGTDYVLKERPADAPTYESRNVEFIKAHTTIPVPGIAKDWVDKNGRQFVMVDRVEGETLETAWPSLSQEARIRIAEQTAECLHQLRSLHSDQMKSLGDAPVYIPWLFLDGARPHGPFASDDEFWQSMVRKLEKLSEKARDALRKRLPPCQPYTFTHGDLTDVNILVKDGNLAAIIDWEWASYSPVWWEFAATSVGLGDTDAEWKKLLSSKMQPFDEGKIFWKGFYKLSKYPELDDAGKALLEELLQEQG